MDVTACVKGLPSRVKIGAYDWAILVLEGDEGKCGEADFGVNHLKLWPQNLTSPSHVVGIFIHECLHVIYDYQGLEKLKRSKDDREETIIIGFEAGLVSLFRDNPKLLSWMKKWL